MGSTTAVTINFRLIRRNTLVCEVCYSNCDVVNAQNHALYHANAGQHHGPRGGNPSRSSGERRVKVHLMWDERLNLWKVM